uniref:Reverse transcriptase domain-containing protein n=1 Tax=Tanacetum cinerariifolium TaxID=118510 RepID=A0A699GW38_TANCI|nr:reverse transcriptase domain-containing protein [Tanacetum cinerariifolium]
MREYKLESRDVKGAPECMRISGFVHGITNPKLIKRLHDKIPKTVDEMMSERKQDRFILLTKTPKEIFALEKGKFKAPPPMTTPVEKQNHTKFCEFHGEVGHNTDEYMYLKKQIGKILNAGKLSHLIKDLKQNSGKEQPKAAKKGEIYVKDKALAILMVQPWERVARQKITQIFSPNTEIFFPPLDEGEGTEGPMIIEAEIGGQIQLLVGIGDEEHSALARMNFVVVRPPSPYNEIIGRPGVKKLQAVPSTAHGMLKLTVEERVITLKSSRLVPLECALVSGQEETPQAPKPIVKERVKVAINLEYMEETIMISSTLIEEGRNKLCNLLQRNLDIFTWKPADISGVPRHIAEHRLNVRKGCSPVRQKKRGQAADRNQAILEEVGKLVEAGIMKEVHYHDWLYNLTAKVEEAFKQMKQLIAKLPMLTAPMEKKELIVYLASSKETVSAVLMTEREAKQMPIYFVSRALRGLELNYTSMEKLVLALVHASKRLKRYFQAHPIIVITDQPIQQVLSRSEVAGRLQKWSIELGEYAIHYRPRVSVKGKILADIIVERPEEGSSDTLIEVEKRAPRTMDFVYGQILLYRRFDATNNEAEYEALIAGLRLAEQMGVKNLQANVDSRLVANQVNGTYVAKEVDMIRYLEKVRTLTNNFKAFSIRQVPRSEHKKADALSKIASTSFAHLSKQVPVKEVKEKSIREVEILTIVEEKGDTWMTPIFKYLKEGTLPVDVKKARAIRRKSWRFSVINGTLYKKYKV